MTRDAALARVPEAAGFAGHSVSPRPGFARSSSSTSVTRKPSTLGHHQPGDDPAAKPADQVGWSGNSNMCAGLWSCQNLPPRCGVTLEFTLFTPTYGTCVIRSPDALVSRQPRVHAPKLRCGRADSRQSQRWQRAGTTSSNHLLTAATRGKARYVRGQLAGLSALAKAGRLALAAQRLVRSRHNSGNNSTSSMRRK